MSQPEVVMRVRFKSALSLEKVRELVDQRAPEFEALAGLRQKYYLQDSASGEYAGLYVWESADALANFRDSALSASIAKAYQAQGEPDIEIFKVIKVLRDDRS